MVQNPNETEDCPDTVEERDVESDIRESMGIGKKHFLCSDYPAAVTCFQEACSLLSDKYGQLAPECSDAYYYYGVSLLEMARMENGVLGNALKGVPEEEDSDKDVEQFEKPTLEEKERQELRQTVEAAMATEDEDDDESDLDKEKNSSAEANKTDTETKETEGKDSKVTEQTSKDEPPKGSESPKTEESSATKDLLPTTEQPSTSNVDEKADQTAEEEVDDPEDISNMQLAWEMLELAKIIFLKKEKREDNSLMVAQCHLKLGELGLEVENYSQAIGDFLECLLLQKEFLSNTDRKLAESHYNLALAYYFAKQYDDAIKHYKNSVEVLESRVKYLEEVIDEDMDNYDDKENSMSECKEVGEIKELIPDIYSKIEDVIEMRGEKPFIRSFSPSVESGETTIGFGSEAQTSSSSCSNIPVKKLSSSSKELTCDITHLVRRKRPSPNDLSEDGSGDSKKVKKESVKGSSSSENHGEHKGNAAKSPTKPSEEVADAPIVAQ